MVMMSVYPLGRDLPILGNCCVPHGALWMLWSLRLSTTRHYQNSSSRSMWEDKSSPQLVFKGGSLSKAGRQAW